MLAVAQVGSLFSADAWNNVTFTAGEVKNPSRNLPLSLALGTGVVIALYIACNFIYLSALPLVGSHRWRDDSGARHSVCHRRPRRHRGHDADVRFRSAGLLMAIAIMISGFGCCNGLILAGARVYYAMAKDGLFFRNVARLHPDLQDAGGFADGADGVDMRPLHLRQLRPASGLHHFCGAGVLHPHDRRDCSFCAERIPNAERGHTGPLDTRSCRRFTS